MLGGNSRDIFNKLPGPKEICLIHFESMINRLFVVFKILFHRQIVVVNQNTLYRIRGLYFILFALRPRIHLLYTHTNHSPTKSHLRLLNLTKKIIVLNLQEHFLLKESGVRNPEIIRQPTGVDFGRFLPASKKPPSQKVLLVANYAERKNPNLLLDVLREAVEFQFTLVGRGWESWEHFSALTQENNFSYQEFESKEYQKLIHEHYIFLSLSTQEGGPLPLLETMACNLIPVVSNVGYSTDLIQQGINGFLFSPSSTPKEIHGLLISASQSTFMVRESIKCFSYERYLEKFLF